MTGKRSHPKDIVSLIKSNSTLAVCGFTLMGACETILREIERNFLENGSPNHLTLLHAAGHSDQVNGIEHLAHEGLVERIIGSHWGLAPKWRELINKNKVEAHCLPQGQITHLFRAMASGKPGNFTKVGLGTFVDPRHEGGKINDQAKKSEGFVELINIKDEEYLFYKQAPIDLCLIRGTTADDFGNVTMEDEALKLEAISVAQATKRFGGKVVVQVKNYAKRGTLPPKEVVIPGIYVDHIIVAENPVETHRQTSSTLFDPVYTGGLKVPIDEAEPLPLSIRKIIGRRAVRELFPDAVVNLGTGIPGDMLGPVSSEEEILEDIHLTIESGAIGGVPMGGTDFGITKNADAIIEHPYQFDYYCGRGVDITFMGTAEVDLLGNVNVSRFGTRTVGCGGFIEITQNARKVVFCSTFTAGGLDVKVQDGKLTIITEGKFNKFLNHVNQITFSGTVAQQKKQDVLYITERAVFELKQDGVVLTEVAPGIDVEKDILAHMEFQPIISPNLKEMNSKIFEHGPMGFKEEFYRKLSSVESQVLLN